MMKIFFKPLAEEIHLNESNDFNCSEILDTDNISSAEDILIFPLEMNRCPFNFKNYRFSDFYGLEFVRKIIRTELKLKNPVLFTSFLSFEHFIYSDRKKKQINPDFEIMLAPGHGFIRLPFDLKSLEKKCLNVKSLTDLQLKDVIHNFCNIYGQIDEITHKYIGESRILTGSDTNPEDLNGLKDNCIAELNSLINSSDTLDKRKYNINEKNYLSVLRNAGEDAKTLIPNEKKEEATESVKLRKIWKVLILDDKPEELITLIAAINKRGIDVIVHKTAEEAIEELRKDYANYISVIISDYRLTEKKEGIIRQQNIQGYDFISEVAEMERQNKLIALSGLSRSFLLESFRSYNINVLVYSKNDVLNEYSMKTFVDTIESEGEIAYSYVIDRPSSSSWSKISEHYKNFRNSSDKEEINNKITEKANEFINKVECILFSKDVILRDNLGLPDLKPATAIKSFRGEAFINKMAARRIAIYFNLKYGFEPVLIYAMMVGNTLSLNNILAEKQAKHLKNGIDISTAVENSEKELANSAKQLINNKLAIKDILPFGILMEESAWLRSAGINVKDLKSVYMSYVYALKVLLQEYFDNNPNVVGLLSKDDDKMFFKFNEKDVPVIKTLSDVQKYINKIAKFLTDINRENYYELLQNILLVERNDNDVQNYYQKEFDSLINNIRLQYKGMIKYE